MFAGEIVTIVDNKPFPDGHAQQRKIVVKAQDGTTSTSCPVNLTTSRCSLRRSPVSRLLSLPTSRRRRSSIWSRKPRPRSRSSRCSRRPRRPRCRSWPTWSRRWPLTHWGGCSARSPTRWTTRLDHLRPSRAKVKRYINRAMSNGMTDIEFLLLFASDEYRIANEGRPASIALKGDTQSGKTFLVEALAVAWADSLGLPKPMPIFTISGSSGVTDFDLFGQTTSYTDPVTGIESLVWLPGIVELAAQCGGILYLDEMNAMGERVTSCLHPVIDHRHQFVNRNKPVWTNGQFMPCRHDLLAGYLGGCYLQRGLPGYGQDEPGVRSAFRAHHLGLRRSGRGQAGQVPHRAPAGRCAPQRSQGVRDSDAGRHQRPAAHPAQRQGDGSRDGHVHPPGHVRPQRARRGCGDHRGSQHRPAAGRGIEGGSRPTTPESPSSGWSCYQALHPLPSPLS